MHLKLVGVDREALLRRGSLAVAVRAGKPARVRLSARLGRTMLARTRVVRARPARRVIRLRLTARGRDALATCAAQQLSVRGRSGRHVTTVSRRLACPGSEDSPSGAPMPAGDLPGWRRVFADDFRGTAVDKRRWGRYAGQPGGDPGGFWAPSHVEAGGGVARLRTYRDARYGGRWVSGGMSSAPALTQRYGRYDVRFRMDAGYGVAGVLLLWPKADHWPPEIDFAENGGEHRGRDHMAATLHYGAANHQIQHEVTSDFTRWHTMGVEWTPRRLVYTLDGRPWATVRSLHVPAEPMELDIQTQAGTAGQRYNPAPDAGTPSVVDMEIDWVVAYAR